MARGWGDILITKRPLSTFFCVAGRWSPETTKELAVGGWQCVLAVGSLILGNKTRAGSQAQQHGIYKKKLWQGFAGKKREPMCTCIISHCDPVDGGDRFYESSSALSPRG